MKKATRLSLALLGGPRPGTPDHALTAGDAVRGNGWTYTVRFRR